MKKVLLGMSGGVDSSVSAVLLKEQGYDVVGMTLELFGGTCCNTDAIVGAKQISNSIGIPHITYNLKEEFQCKVINNFIDEYSNQRTPNPCIECNKYMKFGAMYEKAKELGIPLTFWSHLQKGETMTDGDKVYTPDMVMGEKRKGIKVTYVTDTRPLPIIAEQAKDADLFICEGMYGEPDKLAKAKEYKHMTFSEAASLAKEAQPKEMWLTHYSPSLAHPEEYIEETRKIFSRTIAAKDGRSISLDFEQEEGTK